MSSEPTKPTDEGGAGKISPKDVASGTAIGTAMRVGSSRRKARLAEGAGTAAAGRSRRPGTFNNLAVALLVAALSIGMLAVMIAFGR